MAQEARFSNSRPDALITAHLRALSDSLGLPTDAGAVRISHNSTGAVIWSDYDVTLQLPFNHERTIHFHPTSETAF